MNEWFAWHEKISVLWNPISLFLWAIFMHSSFIKSWMLPLGGGDCSLCSTSSAYIGWNLATGLLKVKATRSQRWCKSSVRELQEGISTVLKSLRKGVLVALLTPRLPHVSQHVPSPDWGQPYLCPCLHLSDTHVASLPADPACTCARPLMWELCGICQTWTAQMWVELVQLCSCTSTCSTCSLQMMLTSV